MAVLLSSRLMQVQCSSHRFIRVSKRLVPHHERHRLGRAAQKRSPRSFLQNSLPNFGVDLALEPYHSQVATRTIVVAELEI